MARRTPGRAWRYQSMAARLKTYWADIDGLHDWIVAAANQRAALEVFGVHQDLFSQRRAGVEDDPDRQEAAMARPGVPLRRRKGTRGAFRPVDTGADWSDALTAVSKGKPPKPPSREKVEKAQRTLAMAESEADEELERLEREAEAAVRALREGRARWAERLHEARDAIEAEEQAYDRAVRAARQRR